MHQDAHSQIHDYPENDVWDKAECCLEDANFLNFLKTGAYNDLASMTEIQKLRFMLTRDS
jgi:hypothetical protein